jgi:hypothetical protein
MYIHKYLTSTSFFHPHIAPATNNECNMSRRIWSTTLDRENLRAYTQLFTTVAAIAVKCDDFSDDGFVLSVSASSEATCTPISLMRLR